MMLDLARLAPQCTASPGQSASALLNLDFELDS
jgi:hypothetical protein